MKAFTIRLLSLLINLSVFGLALGMVILFVIALDEYVINNRLLFLRSGDWDGLITVTLLGFVISYVLKKLLILQWKWKVVR
ncbi:MAG: hypothetical protein IPJ89_04760 [Candidatus Iainarchaeum archaeon]|uniref:Uncharacterized protein n=1 Tax=Candidatus Iainarchaeum sp. TaxID=3101447 RepID=A0A7T9I0Z1_9ARCH|nr:MAG: hypothetical protein IPJ89_04760 [Candidatus Diapherotrites archaeon]